MNFRLAIIIHEKYIPNASETKISLTSLHMCQCECQNNTVRSDGVLSLHQKDVRFETSFSLAVFFQDNKSRNCGRRALFHGWCEHSREERGPLSTVQNVLNTTNVWSDGSFRCFSWGVLLQRQKVKSPLLRTHSHENWCLAYCHKFSPISAFGVHSTSFFPVLFK